ncbi:MAG: prolyl oligopeptidase family serine peptidase, partial [Cytophagales bacterium]|nr:prolyl oligopeptidase family serine peptidase [Cytophagales bacterium]
QLFLIGHSRGGGLALLKAAEDERIKKVAAWAPIHDLTERWPAEVLQKWKEDGVYHIYNGRTKQDMPLRYQLVEDVYTHQQRLDIPKAVKTLEIPLLLVHGTADETLSYQKTEWLSGLGRHTTLAIVENANHVFGGKHPFIEKALPAHSLMILDKTITFFQK